MPAIRVLISGLVALCVLAAATAWAEVRPSGQGRKPVPNRGGGYYALPEKEDEVLVRGKGPPRAPSATGAKPTGGKWEGPDLDADKNIRRR